MEENKPSNLEKSKNDSDILKEISKDVFEKYLKSYMDTSNIQLQLTEYIINSIDTPVLHDESLLDKDMHLPKVSIKEFDSGKTMIVSLNYSVKPKVDGFIGRPVMANWTKQQAG
jgi:hypothetical protein